MEAKADADNVSDRVKALWEQMNSGVPSKPLNPSATSKKSAPALSMSSCQPTNNWMHYLGLVTKEGADSNEKQFPVTEEDKKITEMWQQMNKGITKKLLKHPTTEENTSSKPDNWQGYLGLRPNKAKSSTQKEDNIPSNATKEEAKKLAAAALSAVASAATSVAAASNRGKIEITEIRDFAGQEVEYRKLVDAESKDATEKAKGPAASGVDAVLEQIKKKPKLSVLDKTKKDWGEFKEENRQVEEELDAYKKSTNKYLDKVSFLERADYREFERERDARIAQQARRKPDLREDPSAFD